MGRIYEEMFGQREDPFMNHPVQFCGIT